MGKTKLHCTCYMYMYHTYMYHSSYCITSAPAVIYLLDSQNKLHLDTLQKPLTPKWTFAMKPDLRMMLLLMGKPDYQVWLSTPLGTLPNHITPPPPPPKEKITVLMDVSNGDNFFCQTQQKYNFPSISDVWIYCLHWLLSLYVYVYQLSEEVDHWS